MGFTEHFVFICLKSSIMKSFALFSSKFLKIFNMLAKDLGALYLSNSGDSPCCPPPEPHSAGPSIRGHTEGPSENNPAPFRPPIGGTWRRLAYSFTLHTSLLSEPEKPAPNQLSAGVQAMPADEGTFHQNVLTDPQNPRPQQTELTSRPGSKEAGCCQTLPKCSRRLILQSPIVSPPCSRIRFGRV